MRDFTINKNELLCNGFSIIEDIYSTDEIEQILTAINNADTSKDTFRKSTDLFAIRQFLNEVPETFNLIFTDKLKSVITQVMGNNYFIVKSIYFDKPETSNWYVSYHQDLTISVVKKIDIKGYTNWTTKQNQFAVQPPIEILENITTIRIHLDDTDHFNGALKVVPTSHQKQVFRPETINWKTETETICNIKKGGLMLMKPLTLHSSSRTTNNQKRRVLHIEFSNIELPKEINWAERLNLNLNVK